MLQWMGGSRRKVTASRKSTHKRQKQYFEQRRHQQHHHQEAACGRNYSEGNRTFGQQTENSRSLDILSLLNLSALAQEHKSDCPITREHSEDDALNYLTLPHLPIVQSNDIRTQEQCGIEETRTSSGYQMGTACPKMISTSAPRNHAETLKTDGDKMNHLKMALDCQLSVIDILEDDEPIRGCNNSLAQENHVAFSIEGLGTVETETPVHSPEAHTRSFSHGFSSPSKARNIANPYKDLASKMVNLECELDDLMRNIGSSVCRSSVDQPFCSEKSGGLFSKKKKKIDFEEFSAFNGNYRSHDLLGDDELFCGSKARKESIWNDSGIFAGNVLDESDFHLSDKNWTLESMYPCADFLNTMDFRKEDFGHFTQQEKRTPVRKGHRLGSIESPAPNFKYQKLEDISNLIPTDVTWDSSIGRDYGDLKDEFGESCFITNTGTESLSLPSEESCSSIAERGGRTLLNFKDKLVKRERDIFQSESVCTENDVPHRERYCNQSNTPLEENRCVSGNFTRISNPCRSMQVPELHTTPKKRLKPDHSSRYFEDDYDLGLQNSGCNSFSETSGTTKHVSPVCGLWTEGLLHTIGESKESSRSCLERLSKSSVKCSPGCNFVSDAPDFRQPYLQNVSGSSIQNVFQVSAPGDKPHKTLDVHGCLTPENEKIPRQEDAYSEVHISDYGKFQLQRDDLSRNKSLSSDNGESTGLSDSQIEHRDCEGPTCETPQMGESESKMNCFQQIDNMSSLETSKILKGKQCNADRKCQFTQTSLLRQTGFEETEVEDIQPKQRVTRSDARSTADSVRQVTVFDIPETEVEDIQPKQRVTRSDARSTADSVRQVTVFDNCVLQLFCVQVLKETSAKINGKQDYKK